MDGTHCTSEIQHMDNKGDRMDTMYGQDGRKTNNKTERQPHAPPGSCVANNSY